jgi:hypothetical protein
MTNTINWKPFDMCNSIHIKIIQELKYYSKTLDKWAILKQEIKNSKCDVCSGLYSKLIEQKKHIKDIKYKDDAYYFEREKRILEELKTELKLCLVQFKIKELENLYIKDL